MSHLPLRRRLSLRTLSDGEITYVAETERDAESVSSQTDCPVTFRRFVTEEIPYRRPADPRAPQTPERSDVSDVQTPGL